MTTVRVERPADRDAAAPSRPRRRADCAAVPRPCPHTACRFHVGDLLRPGVPLTAAASCALDIADRHGGLTRHELGAILGVTSGAVGLVETAALACLLARVRVLVPDLDLPPDVSVPQPDEDNAEAATPRRPILPHAAAQLRAALGAEAAAAITRGLL